MAKNFKYRVYKHDNEIIAISSFAGRDVKGIAKCDPRDTYSEQKGLALAEARCDNKICNKRVKRAKVKVAYLTDVIADLNKMLADAKQYQIEAQEALQVSDEKLAAILKGL